MKKNKLLKLFSSWIHIAFPIATLFFVCSCENAPDASGLSSRERKEIESAVINRYNAMIKYAEAGDLESIFSHFDPAETGSLIEGGTRFPTLQDMMDNFRPTWKIKSQDYGIPDTKIFVLSPKFVYVSSTSIVRSTTREGINFRPRPWSVSTIWTLKDGEWFIHSFHQFAADPVPEEAEVKKEN